MDLNINKFSMGPQKPSIVQQAMLEASSSDPASFQSIANPQKPNVFKPDMAKVESDLMDLKGRLGVDQVTERRLRDFGTRGGTAKNIYQTLYKDRYQNMASNTLDANKQELRSNIYKASLVGDQAALSSAREVFNQRMINPGRGRFAMGTRLIGAVNMSTAKGVGRLGINAAKGANVLSKAVLGASALQVGAAGAAVAGLAYMAGSAMGITGQQVSQAAQSVHEGFKQANRPTYGSSQLGQSTQGLVFGLNSRRTA